MTARQTGITNKYTNARIERRKLSIKSFSDYGGYDSLPYSLPFHLDMCNTSTFEYISTYI